MSSRSTRSSQRSGSRFGNMMGSGLMNRTTRYPMDSNPGSISTGVWPGMPVSGMARASQRDTASRVPTSSPSICTLRSNNAA